MSTVGDHEPGPPIFKAVSSSARQLFQLLNCIRFAPKVQVQISNEGLRFAVEDSRVMQGIVFLDKGLFTSFNCTLPASEVEEDDPDLFTSDLPNFQISLSALLETLQIFGAADASKYISFQWLKLLLQFAFIPSNVSPFSITNVISPRYC